MSASDKSRREFIASLGAGAVVAAAAAERPASAGSAPHGLDGRFLLRVDELDLDFEHAAGARRLSFGKHAGPIETWMSSCRGKLAELMAVSTPPRCAVRELRRTRLQDVDLRALVMQVDERLSIPAYLLEPADPSQKRSAVIAVHGHGDVEACIGVRDDYHHSFGLELAKAGHTVLCPTLRGFGVLGDVAARSRDRCLDYWSWKRDHQFTLVTDGFQRGATLIGQTVEDLLRWERWFCAERGLDAVDVAGISYGGDLAITYPVFSDKVRRIFASGTLGSFDVVFSHCYNAPAHCIPGVLRWMDRSDIAGLNAPRPIALHYGELDRPGPQNSSASYNDTVEPSLEELRAIYQAAGAGDAVRLLVTAGKGHEMDNQALQEFLAE